MKHLKENKLFTVVVLLLFAGFILTVYPGSAIGKDKMNVANSPLFHNSLSNSIASMSKQVNQKGTDTDFTLLVCTTLLDCAGINHEISTVMPDEPPPCTTEEYCPEPTMAQTCVTCPPPPQTGNPLSTQCGDGYGDTGHGSTCDYNCTSTCWTIETNWYCCDP